MDEFEKKLLEKIDSGEDLTKSELSDLVYECEVESEEGEDLRWVRAVDTISKLGNRFFRVAWYKGLTEYQEDEFYDQPVEVEKKEYDKTIHVVEWVPLNKEK